MSINLKQRYEQRRLVELRETLEIADFDYLVERHDILTEKLDASEKKNIIKLFNAANKIDFTSFKSAVEIAKKKIGRVISGKFFSSKGNVEKFADLFTGFIQALREVVDTAATVLGEEIDSNDENTFFKIIGNNDLKDSLIQLLNDSIERSARKAFNLNVKSLAMEIMQKSPADITKLSEELTGRKEKSSSSSSLESGGKGESKGEKDKGGGGKGGGDEEGKAGGGGGGGLKFMINDIAVETGKSKKIVKKVIKTLFKLGAIKENKAFSISRLLMEQEDKEKKVADYLRYKANKNDEKYFRGLLDKILGPGNGDSKEYLEGIKSGQNRNLVPYIISNNVDYVDNDDPQPTQSESEGKSGESGQGESAKDKQKIADKVKNMSEEQWKKLFPSVKGDVNKEIGEMGVESFVGSLANYKNNWNEVGAKRWIDAITSSIIKNNVNLEEIGGKGVDKTVSDASQPSHGPGQTEVPGRKTVPGEPSREALGGASSGSGGGGGTGGYYKGMISWLKNFPDLLEKAAEEADSHPKKFMSDIEAGIEKLNNNNPTFLKNLGDKYQKFTARLEKLSTAVSNETGFKQDIVNDIMKQIPPNKIKVNESVSITKGTSLKERYVLRNR